MTAGGRAEHIAERLIAGACRRLPGDMQAERYREWTAELPAIFGDAAVRSGVLRAARAFQYAAGAYRSSRQLRRVAGERVPRPGTPEPGLALPSGRPGGSAGRSGHHPLRGAGVPAGFGLAVAAVVSWVAVVLSLRAFPPAGAVNYLYLAADAVSAVLALAALTRFIRWRTRQPGRATRP